MKFFSKRLLSTIKKWVIPSIGVVALVIFSSLILFEATKATVDITQNGEKITVKTHSKTVGDLIEELALDVSQHDDFSHDIEAPVTDEMEIKHVIAKPIELTIDDKTTEYYTTANTIKAFLDEQAIEISEHDDVSFNLEDAITEGSQLHIAQAYQVTINDAGEAIQVWTTGGKVEDLLATHEIALKKLDKIEPAVEVEVAQDDVIEITRVKKAKDTVEKRLTFKTERKQDSSLAKGTEKVIAAGEEGKLVKTFEITLENGEEVSRELIDEEVVKKQQNKIVAVGTKEAPKQNLVTLSKKTSTKKASTQATRSKTTSSKPQGREMTMRATAYSADCVGCSGITATGINLKADRSKKVIAVDPNVIPLGSTVWVEGYGTAIAGDTGGAIKGNRIDVHLPSHAEAMRFGVKNVKIKIIK